MTTPHLINALEQLDELAPADVEAPARRQLGTLWHVHLDGGDTPLEVRTTNRDMIAWEKTRARHREWPSSDDAPIFATTFVVWNAAKRAGLTALTFEQFTDAAVELERITEEPADPTR